VALRPTRLDTFRDALRRSWCEGFEAFEVERNVFSLATPFIHGDGDAYAIVCERTPGGWRLTDRGSFLARLEAEGWELNDARVKSLTGDLSRLGCDLKDRAISTEIEGELDAVVLADYLKAVSWLAVKPDLLPEEGQEQYRTKLMREIVDITASKVEPAWYDRNSDPKGHWRVDARIEADAPTRPVLLMAVATDAKAERTAATGSWLADKRVGTVIAAVNPDARLSDAVVGRMQDMLGPGFVDFVHVEKTSVTGLLRRYGALVGPN
jgi:hypothetical protein